jgi:transcription elongation factor GreB
MTEQSPRFITPEGFTRIRAEYEQLFGVERPRLVETIAWAAANGDRSENGDYIYGRKRLRELDRRLAYLSKVIKAEGCRPRRAGRARPGPVRSDRRACR